MRRTTAKRYADKATARKSVWDALTQKRVSRAGVEEKVEFKHVRRLPRYGELEGVLRAVPARARLHRPE